MSLETSYGDYAMTKSIDAKSLIAGLLIGALVVFTLGAARAKDTRGSIPRNVSSNARFQMILGTEHSFILDSRTGQVWQKALAVSRPSTSHDFYNVKLSHEELKIRPTYTESSK